MKIGELTVQGFLENSAFKYPEETALIHDGIEYKYDHVNTLVNNPAKTLSGCGLVHDDRVVIVLNNGIEYIVSYYVAMKCGGHRINPQKVEDALIATGPLVETAVIGVPDDILGNRLVAFAVAINNETSENDILAACSGLLPKYKVPSEITLMKSLPKKASGKIDKAQCIVIYNADNL